MQEKFFLETLIEPIEVGVIYILAMSLGYLFFGQIMLTSLQLTLWGADSLEIGISQN